VYQHVCIAHRTFSQHSVCNAAQQQAALKELCGYRYQSLLKSTAALLDNEVVCTESEKALIKNYQRELLQVILDAVSHSLLHCFAPTITHDLMQQQQRHRQQHVAQETRSCLQFQPVHLCVNAERQ